MTPIDIVIDNNVVPILKSTNYLGIHLDNKLSFTAHIDYVESKLSQLSGISWSIKYDLDVNSAKTYYFSFVFSLLSYGCPVWGGVLIERQCPRLHSLYRRIILNLFSWHFPGMSYEGICAKFGFLSPANIYRFTVMTLYYNIRNSGYLPSLAFSHKVNLYNYRSANELIVPFPRTNVYRMHYSFLIPKIWNSIPISVRNERDVNKFKSAYKKKLIEINY